MKYKIMLLCCFIVITFEMTGCKMEETADNCTEIELEQEMIQPQLHKTNTYDTLQVATYLSKFNDLYFLNDCYHNQIIYHDNLEDPLTQWKVLTDDVHYAHTLAGDGQVLLTDDTENNRVIVFSKAGESYTQTQILENIGLKPHYVQYDEKRKLFYVWSSITGELYSLERRENSHIVEIKEIRKIEELFGVYVRSFSIIGDDIYFVSGHNNQTILRVDLDTFEIKERYPVSDEIAGMVQLAKIEDYYYLTISTDNQENQDYATIIRTRDLHTLQDGKYEDIYDLFGVTKGTPYYINKIGDTFYMTHHRTNENVISFHINENQIEDITVVY